MVRTSHLSLPSLCHLSPCSSIVRTSHLSYNLHSIIIFAYFVSSITQRYDHCGLCFKFSPRSFFLFNQKSWRTTTLTWVGWRDAVSDTAQIQFKVIYLVNNIVETVINNIVRSTIITLLYQPLFNQQCCKLFLTVYYHSKNSPAVSFCRVFLYRYHESQSKAGLGIIFKNGDLCGIVQFASVDCQRLLQSKYIFYQ